jgi:creatinine amidohydrolase
VLLKLALWQDVHDYLERRTDVVVPFGGTEQHGPCGPLGTDLIVAEELANELGQERHAMVAPAIPFGVSQVHGAFPGTISLKPATVLALVTESIDSLAQQGFRRFLVVNGHHGSKAILQAACTQVHGSVPESRCLSVEWWELPEVRSVIMEMFGAREGHHATPAELSVVRRFYPRAVVDVPPMERFEPVPQPVTWTADDFRQRYPDGRVGSDPGVSSEAAGERIFAAASRALVEVHRRLVEDP